MNNPSVFGQRIGRYTLLEKLGEGGMAIVYNAFDHRIEQNVAIKVILPSHQASQIFLDQFKIEAKALARLSHTNIVKVLDYGEQKGQPFLVMDFMRGGTLKENIKGKIAWHQAASILAPIARALEYIHKQNLIHRDVKPANILIDEHDQPMLSDFGIVKLIETGEVTAKATGVGVGTPDYMSPEQGMGREVDYRADIYALGVVFYELVTGEKPFVAETPMATIIKHITDPFPRPQSVIKAIPKDVEDVILKAVQKDPQKRFNDMGTFAEALEQLASEGGKRHKRIYRLLNENNPKKPLRWSLAALFLSILFLITIVAGYLNREEIERMGFFQSRLALSSATQIQKTINSLVETEMIRQPIHASLTAPNYPYSPQPSIPTSKTPKSTPIPSNQNQNYPVLMGTPFSSSDAKAALWGIGGTDVISWSPVENQIALGTTEGIFIYHTDTLELIRFIDTANQVIYLQFTADGSKIVACLERGEVKVFSASDGEFLSEFKYQRPNTERLRNLPSGPAQSLSISPNQRYLAVGYKNGTVEIWDQQTGNNIFKVDQFEPAYDLVFSADNRYLYVANGKTTVNVWDIANGKTASQLQNSIPVTKLDISKDGRLLLVSGISRSGTLWDTSSERILTSFVNLNANVSDIAYSPDSTLIAFGLENGQIEVFRSPSAEDYHKSHKPIYSLKDNPDPITSLVFSSDSSTLAASSWKISLTLWNTRDGMPIRSLEPNLPYPERMAISPDDKWLATGDAEGQIRIWNIGKGTVQYQYPGYLLRGQIFSQDGNYLAIAIEPEKKFSEWQINIIQLIDGKVIKELTGIQQDWYLYFSPTQSLLFAGDIQEAIFWDTSTWEKIKSTGGSNEGVGEFYTPDKQKLAFITESMISWGEVGELLTQNSEQPHPAYREKLFEESVYFQGRGYQKYASFASSPTQNLYATGDRFGTIRIWKYSMVR